MIEQNYMNLRSIPCPLNFVRCSLAVEDLKPSQSLKVDLDRGEPEHNVIKGLVEAGYKVNIIHEEKNYLTINIECCGG
tara:strand:- start:1567 stop:1800 length:234 start_codon:yes stop_codon:yes gene_type:complete